MAPVRGNVTGFDARKLAAAAGAPARDPWARAYAVFPVSFSADELSWWTSADVLSVIQGTMAVHRTLHEMESIQG